MTPTRRGRFSRPATLLAGLFLLALLLLPAERIVASGPLQGESETVDIYDRQCTFWLDFDDDGEGDTEIDTGLNNYAHQETPVVGSCEFKLKTPAEATLLLETELENWRSEVEMVREPGLPERKVLQPGKILIPGLVGPMKITVEHKGLTPRSGKVREIRDKYRHTVQVPRPFRLLEIIITTPAGKYDRLEENANSASSAYIEAHARLSNPDANTGGEAVAPDAIIALANELLDDGYPQIADRVLDAQVTVADRGVASYWKLIAIILSIIICLIIIIIAICAIIVVIQRKKANNDTPPPATPSRANIGSM